MQVWDENPLGIDLTAGRKQIVNKFLRLRVDPEDLLTAPVCWATLDYRTITDPNAKADLTWTIAKSGIAHGVSVWFESELIEGIHMSNAPDKPPILYAQALFPFEHPVEVEAGDQVDVKLQAKLVEGKYVWAWSTTIDRFDGIQKASFRQSTFWERRWSNVVSS